MTRPDSELLEHAPGERGGFDEVELATSGGAVACRLYRLDAPTARGAVLVGGAGGGWDTPGRGRLYPDLAAELARRGILTARVRFRNSSDLHEATADLLAVLGLLEREGVERAALVGHSFGGAVVLQAAARSPLVRTVVPLSTQAYGADVARSLALGVSMLLAHGTADTVLPPSCSEYVYSLAREPKRLVLLERTGHGLDETADEVHALVRDWIVRELA